MATASTTKVIILTTYAHLMPADVEVARSVLDEVLASPEESEDREAL